MKGKIAFSAIVSLLVFGGCSKNSQEPKLEPAKKAEVSGVDNDYKIQLCTSENKESPECLETRAFDLDKTNVVLLSPPGDIGVGKFSAYDGKRFGLVPKDEKDVSPKNMLAYGLYLYVSEAGEKWCIGCGEDAPASYEEAKLILEEQFKITGTDEQNKVILATLNEDLEPLGELGLPLEKVYYEVIKAMAKSLVNLTVKGNFPDLSQMSVVEKDGEIIGAKSCCIGGPAPDPFPKPTFKSPTSSPFFLGLSKKEANKIAYEIRDKEGTLKSYEGAFKELICKDNEIKQLYMYGTPDNFVNTNTELSNPRPALVSDLAPYANIGIVHPYDYAASTNNYNVFAETLNNLPVDLTHGLLVVGLKEAGFMLGGDLPTYQDIYSFGSGIFQNSSGDNAVGAVQDIRTNWQNPSTDIYYEDLSQIINPSGESLLARLQGGQNYLDITFLATTNIDFIAVAACTPTPEIEGTPVDKVPIKIECNPEKGEEFFEVVGGTGDDFALPIDITTPSTALQALGTLIKYDQPIEKIGKFGDTLTLPNLYISQAELMINTRQSSAGTGNNRIGIGDFASQKFTIHDPNDQAGTTTLNGGMAHKIFGGEMVHDYNSGTQSGTLLSLLNSGINTLDVLVSDQTEVDTVKLSMCVIKEYNKPCPNDRDSDGDGVCDKEDCAPKDPTIWIDCDDEPDNNTTLPPSCNKKVLINLRDAVSWKDLSGNSPTENNVFSTYPPNPAWANVIWDGAMNWFDFGNASNTEHELNIDFCACGGGEIIVDEMKSDNYGWVYLDDQANGTIVSRMVHNQSTMASWGTSVSGFKSFPATGNGTDHTLSFKVKNFSGPSGGSIDGTLTFIGHKGKCTDEDTLDTGVDINHTKPPIYVEAGPVVIHPGLDPVVGGVPGPIVVDPVGPIMKPNGGFPILDEDPKPFVVSIENLDRVVEANPQDPFVIEATEYSVKIGCDNNDIRVIWTSEEGLFSSYTSEIACYNEWQASW